MQNYIEQMVKKKKSKLDILLVLVLSLGSTAVGAALFILSTKIRGIGAFSFLAIAAVFYFSYMLAVSRNIEYEYLMVHDEIEIDKIVNQKKRKRLTVLNVKKMERFSRANADSQFKKSLSDVSIKKVYACEETGAEDLFFALYVEDGVKKLLLFNPCEEIVDMIVKLNPREMFVI